MPESPVLHLSITRQAGSCLLPVLRLSSRQDLADRFARMPSLPRDLANALLVHPSSRPDELVLIHP